MSTIMLTCDRARNDVGVGRGTLSPCDSRLMVVQPTGTVTLLFTDVEGSTLLLERLGAERFAEALAVHRRVLREAFARHGGYEVDEEGDAFLVAFQAAAEAVAAAGEAQQGLASVEWPHEGGLKVRMGVHTGEPLPAPPKYVGMDVHRAATDHGGGTWRPGACVGGDRGTFGRNAAA